MASTFIKYLIYTSLILGTMATTSTSARTETRTSHNMDTTFDIECQICKWVVSDIESFIASNSTETSIEEYLERLCSMFISHTTCVSIMEEYVPLIINLLEEYETPDIICAQLGYCTRSSVSNLSNSTVCLYIVSLAESLLKSQMATNFIEAHLYAGCKLLPSVLQQTCVDLVSDRYPDMIKYLESRYTPQVVCSLL